MAAGMVHLHNHTEWSLLDGAQRCSQLAERCKALGHGAVAQTDHGTMRGFFQHHKACQKAGIRPIYGMEAYLCRDRRRRGLEQHEIDEATGGIEAKTERAAAVKEMEQRLRIRERFHLLLLAKNDEGLRNLFRLSSIGWLEGFYYRPRIDIAALRDHHEGLILSTACTSGVLARYLEGERYEEMVDTFEQLLGIFGRDLFLEIMPHDFEAQRNANLAMVDLALEAGVPLLATNDAHYAMAEQWQLHELLLAMQTQSTWNDPKRWRFIGGHEYYLRSREEMEAAFASAHPGIRGSLIAEALDHTLLVAESCTAAVVADTKRCLLPRVQIQPGDLEEFSAWAAETYPELYQLDEDLPGAPCPVDPEAPSHAPYVAGSDTSEAAAAAIEGIAGSKRRQVLDLVRGGGAAGVTCEEVERALDMKHQTASARIRELAEVNLIYDSGERRSSSEGRATSTVWKASA